MTAPLGKLRLLIPFLLLLAGLSCTEYEYASPTPGILEVRLAVKNSRQDLIPFGGLDSVTGNRSLFLLNLTDLEVSEAVGARLRIFASLNAIRRNPNGDIYNGISYEARDSSIVMGLTYAPPGIFTGLALNLSLVPLPRQFSPSGLPGIYIAQGSYGSAIDIFEFLSTSDAQQLPAVGQAPFAIEVIEGRTTRVTVTFDLDQSLIRQTESFTYDPVFYVSSVQTF